MADKPQNPIEGELRNAVLLERLKASLTAEFAPFLRDVDKSIRDALLGQDITDYTRARLEGLLRELGEVTGGIYGEYVKQLELQLTDIAVQQANAEALILSNSAPIGIKLDIAIPALQTLKTAAFKNPMLIHGLKGDGLLDSFISKWTESQKDMVSGAIRRGWFEGQTTAQIVKGIRGTKALNYKDGLLDVSKRDAKTVVHTAVQHVANQARNQTMVQNSDVVQQVEWVSTLDSRTSTFCKSMSGRKFPVNEGPRPPGHPNCRSVTVGVTKWSSMFSEGATQSSVGATGGKQVSADMTYYSWLKTQPASFQDIAIGPVRGKLLRDGGIDAQKFADLQFDKNFQPLTLDEMRRLEPEVFKRAGV